MTVLSLFLFSKIKKCKSWKGDSSLLLTMNMEACFVFMVFFGLSFNVPLGIQFNRSLSPGICNCPEDGSPSPSEVCGTDGTTYGNECLAKCNNVENGCTGKCPCAAEVESGKRIHIRFK